MSRAGESGNPPNGCPKSDEPGTHSLLRHGE